MSAGKGICGNCALNRIKVDWVGTDQTSEHRAGFCGTSSRNKSEERKADEVAADQTAGPIARLDQHQRFHWLVAPSSTVIQASAVHTGICDDPAQMVENLFRRLVAAPEPEHD